MTEDEWVKQGVKLFGDATKNWVFVCPVCKRAQSGADLVAAGLSKNDAADMVGYTCIGRIDAYRACNYTAGGALKLHKKVVVFDDGFEQPVFLFKGEK